MFGRKEHLLSHILTVALFLPSFQFLYNQGVSELSAVVWNIIPGGASSRDPRKERQAEFINMLWPKRVWGAVVVVCKESARPERDAAEATRLAQTK